jgi:succinate dehydrogenase/fumarate reductase flavoprotein subunit
LSKRKVFNKQQKNFQAINFVPEKQILANLEENMSKTNNEMSRRNFLKSSLIVGGAGVAMGVTGCKPQVVESTPPAATEEVAAGAPASSGCTPSFLTAPEPIADSKISKTVEADVVIVGCGVAGLAAARAASEQGVSVAVIEKGTTYQYRSGQYGTHNSEYHKSLGMTFDGTAAVGDLLKEMGYRPDQRVWNLWRDYSGEAFDWLLKPALDKDLVDHIDCFTQDYDDTRITIASLHFPYPDVYDPSKEYSPTYPPATLTFLPDQKGILEMSYQICVDNGVDFHFSTWAKQLIRPNKEGRVQGVIAQDMEDNYIKFVAKKGVIMAAGDYGSNEEMVKYYCGGRGYFGFFPNVDAKGVVTNLGEGQQMGIWAGAKIDDGPHAPMTHTLGAALGCDPFLLLNTSGDRFCNEDVAGQQLSSQLFRQKDNFGWYIFDDKYPEQLEFMPVGHGSVNYVVEESKNPHPVNTMSIGKSAVTSREEVESGSVKADTLEGLLAQLEISEAAQKTALASIARYNELCDKGVDEDFNKTPTRMFPVKTGPFYATKVSAGAMLVCIGGLKIDPISMNVVDENMVPIEGLYAGGNNMGGRIIQDYPVTVAGVSHGTALTFGYLAGKKAASA